MMNKHRLFVNAVIALTISQILVILGSWIGSTIFPDSNIISLLGNEGMRWLLSSFSDNLASPFLVWMIFVGELFGLCVFNGFPQKLKFSNCVNSKERFALKIFFLENFIGIILCLVLAFIPHSFALGISGHLFPGPFLSMCFYVLSICFAVSNISFMLLRKNAIKAETAEKALVFGIQKLAPLIVIYFLLKELVEMLRFVLG